MTTPEAGVGRHIAGAQLAHRSLRVTLGRLDEETARRPSLLPRWTVGHVLTHLARNADSHVRILEGALTGEHLEQYPGGAEQRAADIESGSSRAAPELIDDVISTFVRLEDTWDRMTPEAWQGYGTARGEQWPCTDLPFFRWREVEIHHVDLGMGHEVTDWPDDYLAEELPIALAGLPERIPVAATRALLLAWLLGRGEQPALDKLEPWQARAGNYLLRGANR